VSDIDHFVAEIHPCLVAELQALHNGDPQPRLAMWSTKDPVTLFGAGMSGSGWDKVSGIFRSIASRWSDCTDQRVEILAAGVRATWPTRSSSNTPRCRSTASRWGHTPCGSPRSTAARMGGGRSSTATATRSRSTRARAFLAKHQRRKRSGDTRQSAGRPCPPRAVLGAALGLQPGRESCHYRAMSTSPEGSPPDTCGQRLGAVTLPVPSAGTSLTSSNWLCKQVITSRGFDRPCRTSRRIRNDAEAEVAKT
jgi:hypothetical protein